MGWIVGVDVGGTFTDFYAVDTGSGACAVHKTPSTPTNPAQAIVDGLQALCAGHDVALDAIERLSHGTTVATNALLQRRGATVALITTQGFRDLLEIGRQTRPHMFSLQEDYPAPLVPRQRRFEVAERVTAHGEVFRPLTASSLASAVEHVRGAGVEACAVCLLFAFLNPAHEQAIAQALAAIPGLYVSLSSEVRPEFREYERLSTTVLNAYLQPVVSRYLDHLGHRLGQEIPRAVIGINQSSGGLMSIEQARRFPIRTTLSGPAAGVIGAIHLARLARRPDIITLDMGGTSADVALVRGYEAGTSYERDIGGFPVRLPMVDINTVGAGGGSIAWFDRDGLLKVGPSSAGAVPGPACYNLGGEQPTVTDANLLLGRLSPHGLLGGSMPLAVEAARAVFVPVASRLGFTVERTAHGVLGIVVSNMVRAIRAVSVERGYDPRQCTLMPFGGAGPLHASDVARSLGMSHVIVPPAPGLLCAQGLVVSDLKEDFVRTARTRLSIDTLPQIQEHVRALREAGVSWAMTEHLVPEQCAFQLTLDMRYVGQNFELSVLLDSAASPALDSSERLAQLRRLFFDVHERHYGYYNPDDAVEIINYRLTVRSNRPQAAETVKPSARTDGLVSTPSALREVYFTADKAVATPVYARASLSPGQRLRGPAVIDQLDATTLLSPGDTLRVDDAYNLCIEVAL
jgi:N-methylhydantoinase A